MLNDMFLEISLNVWSILSTYTEVKISYQEETAGSSFLWFSSPLLLKYKVNRINLQPRVWYKSYDYWIILTAVTKSGTGWDNNLITKSQQVAAIRIILSMFDGIVNLSAQTKKILTIKWKPWPKTVIKLAMYRLLGESNNKSNNSYL